MPGWSRLSSWHALTWRERMRLVACAAGLGVMHAALAVFGYKRTRKAVERISRHPQPRTATEAEITDAKSLAHLAAVAGRHGMVEATCLRRALLLYAWLRWRGLRPVLLLGVMERDGPFQAHAWVELEGERLLPSDAGYRPFASPA